MRKTTKNKLDYVSDKSLYQSAQARNNKEEYYYYYKNILMTKTYIYFINFNFNLLYSI